MSLPRASGSTRAYEPVAEIARGGMGSVELVVRREGSFARIYALKRLHGELSEDRAVREMFLEEARISGLIRHPNVVPVLDVGEDDFGPYLVMELIEGVSAFAALKRANESREPVPAGLCAEIARQAAHGLAAAHDLEGAGGKRLSVVHRDVSPQNVLLGFDGLVRLTDFGVARALDRRTRGHGIVVGKTGYMSPEQLDGRALDARSDLFALGIVLWELLASRRLYPGEKDDAFARIRGETAPDIRTLRSDVPTALAALVAELLAKSPDARPPDAATVAKRLDDIVASMRDANADVALAPYLLATFADERQRLRSLVAVALERTEAVVSPLDAESGVSTRDRAAVEGPKTSAATVVLDAGPGTAADETSVRRRPPPRWLVLGAGAAIAALFVSALSTWLSGSDPALPTAPSATGRCSSSAECRATLGAASFCDATSQRCASVLSPACPELWPPAAAHDPHGLLLGTIVDRSTPNQLARERAARLAVAGLDQVGGIDGRKVVLLHCDSSVSGAVAASDHLVRAGVPAIIGPSTSAETEAVFSAHAADGVLVISPSATAPQLADVARSAPGLLWRTAPPDELQAAVVVQDLLAPPAPAASLVVVRRANDVYAQSLSVLLQESAGRAGLRVDSSQLFTDRAGIAAAARSAIAAFPDAIFLVSSHVEDAAAFLDAASAVPGYERTTIYVPDAAANDDLFRLTTSGAALFPQVCATRPAPPSTIVTRELAAEFAAAYGGEDLLRSSFTAQTYDATALVLLGVGYAVRDGGEPTGTRIAEGIRLVTSGTHEHQLLGASLAATIVAVRAPHPDVNVLGASGPLDYDFTTGELRRATYEVLGIRGTPPHFEVLRTVDASR